MSNYKVYLYVLAGCILGALVAMSAPGLGVGVGIACGAGVGVALGTRPRGTSGCGPRRGRGGGDAPDHGTPRRTG